MKRNEASPECTSYIRARRPDGTECTIDLFELEAALDGGLPGQYFFLPDSGRLNYISTDEDLDDGEDLDEPTEETEGAEIEAIESRVRFRWMKEFIESVHSITARTALSRALNLKRPFRSFKDALSEYPAVREQWFQFEAEKIRQEGISLIESFDWEVVEVVDPRAKPSIRPEVDPAERVPLTAEEYEWILRGASEVAAKGGRGQLSLLLKGSKDKKVLKHHLDRSPAYGKLSFLTIEEIENRIDRVIRKGDIQVKYLGGDLPLIVLTDAGWEQVRPWANQQDVAQAASADDNTLVQLLLGWRNRARHEQLHLIDAVSSLDQDAAHRILHAWRQVAGKEIRARIEAKLTQQLNPGGSQP